MKINKPYEFKKISIPKNIANRAERVMSTIGCRTMTSFVSIGMTAYMNELESKQDK